MSDWPSLATSQRLALSSWSDAALGPMLIGLTFSASVAWPAANRAIYIPFTMQDAGLVQHIGWINGAGLSGNVDAGIHKLDGTLLVSAGTTAQAGVSLAQTVNIADTLLVPGDYCMCLASSSAAATFTTISTLGVSALRGSGVRQQALAGLPLSTNASPATFAAPATAYLPLISIHFEPVI